MVLIHPSEQCFGTQIPVGESEKSLKNIFIKSIHLQPSIIFIDEIDALCPRRDKSSDDVDKRMVSTLLTLMDGVGDLDDRK